MRRARLPSPARAEGLPGHRGDFRTLTAGRDVRVGQLPQPIFTPATKAQTGHDENIDRDQAAELVGADVLEQVEQIAIALYDHAAANAAERGIIIADTKFELGFDEEGAIVLGDEALTPDSSRFGRPTTTDRAAPSRARQAVRARLLRGARLGQDRARP